MNLQQLLGQINPGAVNHRLTIPAGWHQGRTAYGGLSSVLAYRAATLVAADLPPLQSAQIAFIGPLSGEVEISASLLRRGKNSAYVDARIVGEKGVGLTATFIFMAQRDSNLDHEALARPDFPPLPLAAHIRGGPPEYFTGNLQYGDSRSALKRGDDLLGGWHRFADHDGLDPLSALICIADAMPPAAMALMDQLGPLSSMNWQFNMLSPAPSTKDGWWYLESRAHHAAHGASSQYMSAWNSDGKPMMAGMQAIAIF